MDSSDHSPAQKPTLSAAMPEAKTQTKMSIDSVPKYITLPPPKIPVIKVKSRPEIDNGFYSF